LTTASRVALLLLASGFCSLVYQVAWLRLLRLVFGASTAASAAVLAVFMGGLGAGALLLGPRADRSPSPLRLYARLEVGIALAAAATPLLVPAARSLYFALGGSETLGLAGGTAVRLVLAAAILGLPAFWMGGTLPAAVRAVAREADREGSDPASDLDQGRRRVGLLYGANTVGAVAGALVTTFLAVELLGIRGTILAAALLNLAVAGAAFALSRRGGRSRGAIAERAEEPFAAEDEPPAASRGLVLAAAALVGFAFFAMELVWYRMLAPILGGTSYTFGLILATALLGIGAGGLAYAWRPKRAGRGGPSAGAFALTCALEAVALAVPFALGDRIALWALRLVDSGVDPGSGGFPQLVGGWTLVTAVVVLPAALVAGYQFPLLVGLLGTGSERLNQLGREVGLAYGWNTGGAIAGSIAGGFGLLPLLSAPGAWRALVALLAGLAVASAAVSTGVGGRRSEGGVATGAAVGLAIAGALLVLLPGPTAFWRHAGIGAGRFGAPPETPNGVRAAIRSARSDLVWEEDGLESSVALVGSGGYSFLVNGKSDGSALGDGGTQILGGLVGAMLHPRLRSALVIGLGTGSTAGWLAEVPGMERVDVVELEPAILRVAQDCAPVNHDVLDHPKVEVILGDGRELLLTSSGRWDVIFSEPSNPYRAGISSLFSREFYQAVRERLNEGGIFLQWLQGYEVDRSVVRTAYATLGSVFGAVESWQTLSQDLLLVATAEPLAHDWQRVAERAAAEPYRSALARAWGVEGPEGFYAGFVGGPELAAELMGEEAPVNTDDHPAIEFGFARNLGRSGGFDIEDLVRRAREIGADGPAFPAPGSETEAERRRRTADARLARGAFFGQVPGLIDQAPSTGDLPRAARRAREAYLQGAWSDVVANWSRLPEPPRHRIDILALGQALAIEGDPESLERARELARGLDAVTPAESEALLALVELYDDNALTAAFYLEALFRRLRTDPWIEPSLLSVAFRATTRLGEASPALARDLDEALSEPFAVGLAEVERLTTRLNLAAELPAGGERGRGEPACVEVFAELEPWIPWSDDMLSARASCYGEADSPLLRRALRDLERYRENATPEEPSDR
jgi:spermidine synthase